MSQDVRSVPKTEAFLVGGGAMGEVVRAKDWAKTPLGPIEFWPQSLRTTVSLCLSSNFPISIAWGAQRVQIYNDGYWPICATKHPHSMGQDFKSCWFSAWPVIGESFERASQGETCFLVNQRMFLDRLGYLEETFFTFSFSPIRDETGNIGGLFHPVTELTQQSLAERRLLVLRDFADRTNKATSLDQALGLLAETLKASELDVPFALFYRLEHQGASARRAFSVGLLEGESIGPERLDWSRDTSTPWSLAASLEGRRSVVTNLAGRFSHLECGPYKELPHTALLLPIPLPGQSHPFGVLIAGVSVRRPLDDSYSTFFDMLGEAVANALAKAHTYEQERKRAEALAELDRAKTVFFSNISHEFRTPLTLMLGPLEELLASSPTDISQVSKDRLAVVKRNGLRLLRLVNTLLEFSRIEAGRTQASYVPTDLATYTADLVSSFRSATDRAGLRLIVHCPALPKPVYVDRDMWEKIVLNLVSNAFKFTLEGEIVVTMASVDDAIELRVRDTGVGIPIQEMPRLFERFYRVQNTRSRTHEGSGIGLALVQELVKLHGGIVRAESRMGEGSTFLVTLPFGTAHLSPDMIEAEPTVSSTARGAEPFVEEALRWLPDESNGIDEGMAPCDLMPMPLRPSSNERRQKHPRILIADDNADMRQYIARLLIERYDVTMVPDGEAALRAARADVPDLLLSDVMMPRLDGFGLLRAIRNHPSTKTIPVILLSARAGEQASIEGLEQGADDYLIKPFSARELLARVAAHLEMARVREEFRLRTLATELNIAEQRERKQIAMELHDHLQQLLVLGKIKLSQCKRLGGMYPASADIISQTDDVLSEALRYTRTLVVELSPPVLREHGLAPGLTWLAEYMKRHDMVVTVRILEPDNLTLTEDQAALLFQSVRELLINASKHAQSHEATVTLERMGTELRIEVKDHGAGFSLAKDATAPDPTSLSSKFGLLNICERMETLGGRLVIESAPGIGTTATLMFPMPSGRP